MKERFLYEQERLPELLAASQEFVAAKEQYPGMAYEPISIPLSWLFLKSNYGKVVGYRLKPWRVYSSTHGDEVDNRIKNLKVTGLIRLNAIDVKDDDWFSRVKLTEFQPALLVRRTICPESDERLYELDLAGYDGEGSHTETFSKMIYSNTEGLLNYQGNAKDPLTQAIEYLADRKLHPRAR
jgi:hypothetical protein